MKFKVVNRDKSVSEIYGYLDVASDYSKGKFYFSKGIMDVKHGGWVLRDMYVRWGNPCMKDYQFRSWISCRVCPSGRHNIDGVLRAYGMKKYNALELCVKRKGICEADYLMFEELSDDYDFSYDVAEKKEEEMVVLPKLERI